MSESFQRKGGDDEKLDEPALKLRNYRPLDEKLYRDEVEQAEVEQVDEHVNTLEAEAHENAPGADTNELGTEYKFFFFFILPS